MTMVFPEPGIGFRLFPADLSASVTDYYREQGVEVLAGETVAAASGHLGRRWGPGESSRRTASSRGSA